jgi:hypothetical protein
MSTMQEVTERTPESYAMLGVAGRKSQPFYSPFALGGYGFIPRRGVNNPGSIATKDGLQSAACGNALRLLEWLADLDPEVGLATWNALRLTTAPGAVRIVATKESNVGAGDDAIDDEGTADLDAFWKNLPGELGGFDGVLRTMVFASLFTGMICIEAVPGPVMSGLEESWPVDSLTIAFRREEIKPKKWRLIPYQWQVIPQGPGFMGNYVRLDTSTFFWRSLDNGVDNPYGRAPFAPAVSEVLCHIAMIKDLRDAIHNSAWDRLGFGFDWTETARIAREVYKITDPAKVNEWVQKQFEDARDAIGTLKPDDNIVYDKNGGITTIEGATGLTALEAILKFLRSRVIQALKSLPTLMGINDGSTQTYTTVEWQIYAAGLESLRSLAVSLLEEVANLHLRLLGKPLKAEARVEKIRTNDRLVDAQAEAIQIKNAKEKIRLGWSSHEEESINITGSAPVAEPMPGALDPTPSSNGGNGTQDPNAQPGQEQPAAA